MYFCALCLLQSMFFHTRKTAHNGFDHGHSDIRSSPSPVCPEARDKCSSQASRNQISSSCTPPKGLCPSNSTNFVWHNIFQKVLQKWDKWNWFALCWEKLYMEYVASIPTHYETCHPNSQITLLVLPRSTPGGFRLCRLIITWKPIPNCAFSGFACMQIDLQSESRPSKPVSAPKASRTKKHWCHCLWPWAPVIVFNRLITSRQSASKDEPFSGISWNFQIFHILSMSLQL